MEPIVLIHGYSAESKGTSAAAIAKIYGSLPEALANIYGAEAVVEINLSRYITLEDGITIDDISRRPPTTKLIHHKPQGVLLPPSIALTPRLDFARIGVWLQHRSTSR